MEKLVYVHVARFGDSFQKRLRFGDSFEEGVIQWSREATNDWYVIQQKSIDDDDNDYGYSVEMPRAFEEVGQLNHPHFALVDPACVAIGSRLYVIGGTCFMCKANRPCDYEGSSEIRFLDTRNPKDGWMRTSFNLPFSGFVASSAVVDNQWLYLFPHQDDFCYGFNVVDGKSVRKVPQPGDCTASMWFCTSLSPGTLVAYKRWDNTMYQLDCESGEWSVYHRDVFSYSFAELCLLPHALDDDGIVYIFLHRRMKLVSYDIRNKKELHVVDLPKHFWLGRDDAVQLFVLSKNRFCLVWRRWCTSLNKMAIFYSRFSVSYHLPHPTVHVEEMQSFHIVGARLLNVVPVQVLPT